MREFVISKEKVEGIRELHVSVSATVDVTQHVKE